MSRFMLIAVCGVMLCENSVRAKPPELVLQDGHSTPVSAVAISPDEKWLLTGSTDGKIVLWDAVSRQLLRVFKGPRGAISSLVFHPTRPLIASVSRYLDRSDRNSWKYVDDLLIYDMESGKTQFEVAQHIGNTSRVRFRSDSEIWLAPGNYGWDFIAGRSVKVRPSGLFSPDLTQTLSHDSTTGVVTMNKFVDAEEVWTATNDDFKRGDIEFSPSGRYLVSHSEGNGAQLVEEKGKLLPRIALWNAKTGKQIHDFNDLGTKLGYDNKIEAFCFSPSEDVIALIVPVIQSNEEGDGRFELQVIDAPTGRKRMAMDLGERRWVPEGNMAFSRDGRHVVLARLDSVEFWDTKTGKRTRSTPAPYRYRHSIRRLDVIDHFESAVAFAPSGRVLIGTEYGAFLCDPIKGTMPLGSRVDAIATLASDGVGRAFISAPKNGLVRIWDITAGSVQRTLPVQFGPSTISSTGAVITSALHADTKKPILHVWNGASDPARVLAVKQLPDGLAVASKQDRLAAVSSPYFAFENRSGIPDTPGELELWNLKTGELIRLFRGHIGSSAVAIDSTGERLLTAGQYGDDLGQLLIWNANRDEPIRKLPAHKESILGIAFSANGRHAATASWDKTAIVWDTTDWTQVVTLTGSETALGPIAFSPDGTKVIASGMDGSAGIWDARTGKRLQRLSGQIGKVFAVLFTRDNKHAMTGSEDGTTRIWDVVTGAHLATLVTLQSGGWLVCTPDGLFDGDSEGRNRVSYRVEGRKIVNGRVTQETNVVPVDRFFKEFYRPGLLAAILAGERPKPTFDFATQSPPKVRIISPLSGVTEQNPVEITVEAEDQGGGVSPPWMKHNGTTMSNTAPAQTIGKIVRRTFRVQLIQGKNTLQFRSATADDSWESEPAQIELTYVLPIEKPRLFLLAVGINKHRSEALNLHFASPDAKLIHELFVRRSSSLYQSIEPILLQDENATKIAIQNAFKSIAKQSKPQDVFVFYAAGHGGIIGSRYYLMTHDYQQDPQISNDDSIRNGGISDDDLADLIVPIKALKKVMILDTCNSGAAQLFRPNREGRGGDGIRGAADRLNRGVGSFVIAAAGANAEAKEPKELGHGILTYSLLASLQAVDDGPLKDDRLRTADPNGFADLSEVYTYAIGRVPRLMKQYYGTEQNAAMNITGNSFPILPIQDQR